MRLEPSSDHLHTLPRESFWYRIFDNPKDTANNKDNAANKKRLQQRSQSSIWVHTGLHHADYLNMLQSCELLQKRGNGFKVQQKKWEAFLINHGITEGEICASQPSGSPGQWWYIRLGPKQTGYHQRAVSQVTSGLEDKTHLAPPRIGNIATLCRTLRMIIKGVYENLTESEFDSDIGVQPDI